MLGMTLHQFVWLLFNIFACWFMFQLLDQLNGGFDFRFTRADRVSLWTLALMVAVVLTYAWLLAFREYQHKPHRIVTSINGQVLGSFTTTNPAYVTYEHRWEVTSNGLELRNLPVTNYYWHIWKWLK